MTDYIEFARIIKEKYPQYKDVDDLTLAKKVVEKYPEYKEKVSFEGVKDSSLSARNNGKKGIDLTPSGLYKNSQDTIASLIAAPFVANKKNTSLVDAYKQNKEITAKRREEKPTPIQDLAIDLAAYSLIPTPNAKAAGLAKAGQFLGQAALQGGLPGMLEGLKNGDPLGGAAAGTGIVAALQGIAPVAARTAKVFEKPAKYIANKAIEGLTDLKPATIAQVVKPNSKALDLSEAEAQNLLMNTTEGIRNNYKNLLQKRVSEVEKQAGNLRNLKDRVNANELVRDIEDVFNSYQGENINPARNMTGRLENNLIDLVESGKPIVEIDTSVLPNGIIDKKEYNKTIRELYKNNASGKTIKHPQQGDIYMRGKGANETINKVGNDYEQLSLLPQIDKITENSLFQNVEPLIPGKPNKIKAKDFDVYRGRAKLHGNNIDTEIKVANTPQGKMYYLNERPLDGGSGFMPEGQPGDILGSNNIIADNEAYFNSLSPIDLQKIKQQVGHMVNWEDEAARNYKNPILEQIYGKFDKRLSDLSPELAAANKAYSNLMDFQKNEGIRRILNNQNNIDTASSALKNYNSTVTKGNTNRNIQDLEKLLVKEGYESFLNNIDDVNAAMDLLTQPKTGRNFLGAQTLAKGLVTPALKAIREGNKTGAFNKLQNIKSVLEPLGKLIRLGSAREAADMLKGGIEYNDYQ